jgi:phenylacetate-CoA ligase
VLASERSTGSTSRPVPFPCNGASSLEYDEKCLRALELALGEVSAYQSWRTLDPGTEYGINERYAAMPVFTKKDIRENFPQGLLPKGRDASRGLASGEIDFVKTSGSTGDAVTNIWNQKWWDASEKASWSLNSVATNVATGEHREAILANPRNVGFISDEAELPMEKRCLSRFLYLNEKTNPLSWTPGHMDRMIRELEVFRPVVLEANPSLLARLCRYIVSSGKTVFQPGLIVFTYEYPTKFHYQQILRAFSVPMASSYGTTEVGYVFMQCEKGMLHQNVQYCRVDFQPLKPEHGGPHVGRILVTTFNNPWYILVRFDVGDLVRLNEEGSCPCGRQAGLILSTTEGRSANVTLTCGGRLVTLRELDNAVSVLEDVEQHRLDQLSRDEYRLHLVSPRTDRKTLSGQADTVLKKLYGEEADISVVFETDIAPSPSGKYSISETSFPVNIEDFLDTRYARKATTIVG